ncbi:MAG TPA: hypothetical protein VJ721_01165, partial [Chthoniobacterales bacterium]|nr:hypothetical protein [Chthoniobacterales bacterium]
IDQTNPAGPTETPSPPAVASNENSATAKPPEPAPPAIGPDQSASESSEESPDSESTESREFTTETKKKSVGSDDDSTARTPRVAHSDRPERSYDYGSINTGRGRARIIGRTPDGRPVVKLTSGRVVILPRHYNDNGLYQTRPRRRIYSNRPDDGYAPPLQPFDPNE